MAISIYAPWDVTLRPGRGTCANSHGAGCGEPTAASLPGMPLNRFRRHSSAEPAP
jgi:hypothetical protein